MNNQPRLLPKPIQQKWPGIPVSDWVSDWHKQNRPTKDAQIARLVRLASSYDPQLEKWAPEGSALAFQQLEMLSKSDTQVLEGWLSIARRRREREFEAILAERQERTTVENRAKETGDPLPKDQKGVWTILGEGLRYDDIPLTAPEDLAFMTENPRFLGPPPEYYSGFESACRQGSFATVQSIIASEVLPATPAFLHHGLCLALKAGNVEVARYFLATGAPVVRKTPNHVLSAPVDQQIPLFELLIDYGWTPNAPGAWGAVLLSSIVTNRSLLRWFLDRGANPNLGEQDEHLYGEPISNSCVALEKMAYQGDLEAVRMLLDSGAMIQNGFPLHAAAGACPPGGNPHADLVIPSEEFDRSRIPVMALLVERGADVNQLQGPQKGNMVPGYAIVHAVMAGAVERVRWLLENGADPTLKGPWGNAVEYASKVGSGEMRLVLENGVVDKLSKRLGEV